MPLITAENGRVHSSERDKEMRTSRLPEPEIVTKKGKPVSVILPIEQYQEMLERLEDADDVAWLKKAGRR